MRRSTIGVCIIGSGRAGMIHAENFQKNIKHAELVALVDSSESSLAAAGAELGIDSLYSNYKNAFEQNENINAVVVTTPTVFHSAIVIDAASRGIHVLCEKPMAMKVEECVAMNEAARNHDIRLLIGFMRRFDKNFRQAKQFIDEGEIGNVVQVKSITHGPSIPRPWQYDVRKSNGPLAEVNSHDIDTLRWISGSEFAELYAVAGNYRCRDVAAEFPDFYDNLSMVCLLDNGMQGFIGGAVSVKYAYDSRVEVLGTEGMVSIGHLPGSTVFYSTKTQKIQRTAVTSWSSLYKDAYLEEDKEFINAILEERDPIVTGIDGLRAVEVVNAGNTSILERRVVQLKNN